MNNTLAYLASNSFKIAKLANQINAYPAWINHNLSTQIPVCADIAMRFTTNVLNVTPIAALAVFPG
jgi:hypothetical protein